MGTKATIVMYHYVRDLFNSRYPDIKGLDVELFKEQLLYLKKHYNFIKMNDLINAFENNHELPPKAVFLTFDDAYIDHYTQVFPLLDKYKIEGAFYAPIKAITQNKVLDVNKIHFVLASVKDKNLIIKDIYNYLDSNRAKYNFRSNGYYFDKLAKADRFDSKEVIFIKRLLQVGLEESIRNELVNLLFEKFVSSDEESFSRELYMTPEQLECMNRNGMHVGSHGYDHYWLGSLSKEKQEVEIKESIKFLRKIGVDVSTWTICYPYGNYNIDTLNLLKKYECKLAFTTKVDIANISKNDQCEIPRLDTNDIPKDKNSVTNEWFSKA